MGVEEVSEARVKITADGSGFARSLKQQTSAGFAGLKSSLGSLGPAAAKAGAAMAVGLAVGATKAVTAFAGFDQQMREVFTLLPGISEEASSKMTADLKDFGAEFGVLATDAVPALYDALSAGVPQDNVFAFMEDAQKFASAGATDLGTAMDGLTTAVNAFGLPADEASRAADALFGAVKAGKTTVPELSASLFQVAPIAASLGVTIEETAAGFAALTAQGVPTAAAATQLKGAFAELGKQGTVADKAFRELAGVGFKEFLADGGDVQSAFNLLADGAAEAGIGVGDMFGSVEAGQAVLGLTGDQADRFAGALETVANGAGGVDEAFQTMDQGLIPTMNRIKARASNVLLSIGEQLAPAFEAVANGALSILEKLGPKIDAAVGGALDFASTAASVVKTGLAVFSGAFSNFEDGITSSGVFGQIEKIGIFAGKAFAGLAPVFSQVKGEVDDFFGVFQSVTSRKFAELGGGGIGSKLAVGVLKAKPIVAKGLKEISKAGKAAFEKLLPIVEKVATNFVETGKVAFGLGKDLVVGLLPSIKDLASFVLDTLVPAFLDFKEKAIDALVPVLESLVTVFVDTIIPMVRDLATDMVALLLPVFERMSTLIVDQVLPALGDIALVVFEELLPAVVEIVAVFAEKVLPVLLELGVTIYEQLYPALLQLATVIISDVLPPVIQLAGFFVEHVLPVLVSVAAKIIEVVLPAISFLIEALAAIITAGVATVTGIGEFVSSAVAKFTEFKDSVVETFNSIKSKILALPTAVQELPTKMKLKFIEVGKSIIEGLKDGISGIASFGADLARGLIDAFKSAWNSAADFINEKIPNKINLKGLPDINLPDNPVPRLAQGGLFAGRQGGFQAVVAEDGDEGVYPLEKHARMRELLRKRASQPLLDAAADVLGERSVGAAGGASGAGGPAVVNKYYLYGASIEDTLDELDRRHSRRSRGLGVGLDDAA